MAETTCEDPDTSGQPTQGFDCAVGFDVCSDSKEYSLECFDGGDLPECECVVNGNTTGRFTPTRLLVLRQPKPFGFARGRSSTENEPPQTWCDLSDGELPGFNPAECAAQYTVCSDGHEYEVRCSGSAGNVVCACIVDGLMVGSYQSPTGICPFVDDPDSGRIEANTAAASRLRRRSGERR